MGDSQEAEAIVRQFLEALENRDLELASSMLAPNANIVFPGPKSFSSLEEIVSWARERYQWVRKRFERFDSVFLPDGTQVVYVTGSLYGVNFAGEEFSGVRFID